MEAKGPSRTAMGTAMLRAAHYILDDEPKILADPFAQPFAGFASDKELLNALEARNPPDFPRMRAVFTLRNRYAEDELAQAVREGVSQYVVLGAGLHFVPSDFKRETLAEALERGGFS
jgi:O-methyltransferase involved in polyketide biosynthesis